MNTKNLNYAFNVEYYTGCRFNETDDFSTKNKELLSIPCNRHNYYKGDFSFELQTRYPGLLIGVGNMHDSGGKSDIALGFTFDYVTGTPYIPGSSIKGVLRSAFERPEYIKALLGNESINVKDLEEEVFDGIKEKSEISIPKRDAFYDAYPSTQGFIMALEAITPHGKDLTKDPNPLTLIKVKPNVKFIFSFKLSDGVISAEAKKELFKRIIIDLGMGAKTNVGFGVFTDSDLPFDNTPPDAQQHQNSTQRSNSNHADTNADNTYVICPHCNTKNYKYRRDSHEENYNWQKGFCRNKDCPNRNGLAKVIKERKL